MDTFFYGSAESECVYEREREMPPRVRLGGCLSCIGWSDAKNSCARCFSQSSLKPYTYALQTTHFNYIRIYISSQQPVSQPASVCSSHTNTQIFDSCHMNNQLTGLHILFYYFSASLLFVPSTAHMYISLRTILFLLLLPSVTV